MNLKHFKLICLFNLPGIGRKTILQIDKPLLNDDSIDIKHILKTISKTMEEATIKKAKLHAQKAYDYCMNEDIQIISFLDDDYPDYLHYYTDKPVILFIKGSTEFLYNTNKNYAIIGARKAHEYSKAFAFSLGKTLVEHGYKVVSGLAVGCDTSGHLGCLDEGGTTIAILPCGLDRIYPFENTSLANRIINNRGSLVSEYVPFTRIEKWNFIERDRLQAIFSKGLFVVETSGNDGTMHTVKFGVKYKKTLYCYKPNIELYYTSAFMGNRKIVEDGKGIYIDNINRVNILLNK